MAKGKSLFPDFRDMDIHSALKVMKILGNLEDVEIVLPGHGKISDQQNFHDERRFIQALHDEVLAYSVEGRKLSEIRDLVQMEEFSGMEVLRKLRESGNAVKVIMVTGNESPEIVSEASRLEVAGYIHKPLVLDELEKIVLAELNN